MRTRPVCSNGPVAKAGKALPYVLMRLVSLDSADIQANRRCHFSEFSLVMKHQPDLLSCSPGQLCNRHGHDVIQSSVWQSSVRRNLFPLALLLESEDFAMTEDTNRVIGCGVSTHSS